MSVSNKRRTDFYLFFFFLLKNGSRAESPTKIALTKRGRRGDGKLNSKSKGREQTMQRKTLDSASGKPQDVHIEREERTNSTGIFSLSGTNLTESRTGIALTKEGEQTGGSSRNLKHKDELCTRNCTSNKSQDVHVERKEGSSATTRGVFPSRGRISRNHAQKLRRRRSGELETREQTAKMS